jgi:hypothetical protein
LRGQRFKILSSKTFNNGDILSLQVLTHRINTVTIPREWTDKADPNPYHVCDSPPILSFLHLEQLADLVSALMQPAVNEKVIDL